MVSNAAKNISKLHDHGRRVPTKQCPVCQYMFDVQVLHSVPEPRMTICGSCLRQLTEGFTGVVKKDGTRHAWLSFKGVKQFEGKVIKCDNDEDWVKLTRGAETNSACIDVEGEPTP